MLNHTNCRATHKFAQTTQELQNERTQTNKWNDQKLEGKTSNRDETLNYFLFRMYINLFVIEFNFVNAMWALYSKQNFNKEA